MKLRENELSGMPELIFPATIKTVSAAVRSNSNETEFVTATAEVQYPNGQKKVVGALLWKASLESNPEAFTPGSEVELVVQTEGAYKGYCKVQLPTLECFNLDYINLEELMREAAMVKQGEVI